MRKVWLFIPLALALVAWLAGCDRVTTEPTLQDDPASFDVEGEAAMWTLLDLKCGKGVTGYLVLDFIYGDDEVNCPRQRRIYSRPGEGYGALGFVGMLNPSGDELECGILSYSYSTTPKRHVIRCYVGEEPKGKWYWTLTQRFVKDSCIKGPDTCWPDDPDLSY